MRAPPKITQRDRAVAVLRRRGIARLAEFRDAGITATAMSRMARSGEVLRLGRGVYQLPCAAGEPYQSLAEVALRVPRGVVCLGSALAFHGLTDQMPPKVWVAIGQKDWRPTFDYPPIRTARFPEALLRRGVEYPKIAGVRVPMFGVVKTVTDLFRYRRTVGEVLAVEGLRQALRLRKATPAQIAREAKSAGVWQVMQPYLVALTSDA